MAYDIEEWMWGIEEVDLKGRQEMVMQLIAGLSEETCIVSVLVEVVGNAEGKEGHGFLETLLVVHLLLGLGVPIEEAIEVPSIQP